MTRKLATHNTRLRRLSQTSRKSRAPLRSTSSSTPVRPRDALMGTPHVNVSPVLSEATYAVLYVWILSLIPVKLYSGLTE